jgi:toxin FitB
MAQIAEGSPSRTERIAPGPGAKIYKSGAETRQVSQTQSGSSIVYLLDTNVISELRKPKPHGAVLDWFQRTPEVLLFLSAVTIGELQAGVQITRKQNRQRAEEIEAWIDSIELSFQILPADARVYREWARLMESKPDHISEDAMIAATARAHQLTVVTRNTRDFASFHVPILNPFQPA